MFDLRVKKPTKPCSSKIQLQTVEMKQWKFTLAKLSSLKQNKLTG